MCMVSAVMTDFTDRWPNQLPMLPPNPIPGWTALPQTPVSREEFDQLRKEVSELKQVLEAALKFDLNTGQPDCENKEKLDKLRKIADIVGISLDDLFPKGA